MNRGTALIVVTVAGLIAGGCGEKREPFTPAPSVSPSARTSPSASLAASVVTCDFDRLYALSLTYFPDGDVEGSEAELVEHLLRNMRALGGTTPAGRDSGFAVMAHIAQNVKNGNADAADASDLTNGLLACMYTDPGDLPATFPEDFTVAADPAQGGAYEVRGGATDPATPALSRDGFSGIAPPLGSAWGTILSADPAPNRILAYGRPGAQAQTYDWKVAPRSATFSPGAIVGVCVDPNSNTTSMLSESERGLLAFSDAYFLNPPCSATIGAVGSSPRQFARRVLDWGVDLFAPRTAWAATVLNPGGLGGSTGGIHSLFGPVNLQPSGSSSAGVALTFVGQPGDVAVGVVLSPPVRVRATATATGDAVAGVLVCLTRTLNNGVPAQLFGTTCVTTSDDGVAVFSDLSVSKTGANHLIAAGGVTGRPAITVAGATSVKFNSRPR